MQLIKLKTIGRLGLSNLIRVVWYRLSVRTGINPVRSIHAQVPQSPFFETDSDPVKISSSSRLNNEVPESIYLFGNHFYNLNRQECPNWFNSPISDSRVDSQRQDWWRIPDFANQSGDIKQYWELSRFDWVIRYAQLATVQNSHASDANIKYRAQLDAWLVDWLQKNPPYKGINWKCGQEASIRVMHLICAARITGILRTPTAGLLSLIELHIQRIAPTMSYAVAQDNNHGTSEAAALFVGGLFLEQNGVFAGAKWAKVGRKWLENRAARLIGADGSFSQYSVNYHRVMLDTLAFAETARQWFDAPSFSSRFYQRAVAATRWLAAMTNLHSGDAPNLGANDGARLFPLTNTDYRDYRPSLIWAYNVFDHSSPLDSFRSADKSADNGIKVLDWLGLTPANKSAVLPRNEHFADGGFAVLSAVQAKVVVHYPRFRFRPSQNDLLHVDLWVAGENLLRDAGTYSYNCQEPWQSYFPSTAAHNTVQFDDREQMPRLSRFLLGAWPKARDIVFDVRDDADVQRFACTYRDYLGATHERSIRLSAERLTMTDTLSGFRDKAVARYRLSPQRNWSIKGNIITDGRHTLTFSSDVKIEKIALVEGWESRYYFQKSQVPVVEVTLTEHGSLNMEYQWA